MLDALNEASVGTVASYDLMLVANRAMSFGVGKNMGDMQTLMEIARLKAQEMGTDIVTAYEDIVTGVGR